jgi:hypothetical protein
MGRTLFSTLPVPRTERRCTGNPIDSKWPRKPILDTIRRDWRLPMKVAQLWADRYYSREEFRRWCEAQTKGRASFRPIIIHA